jgi:hypothetical protein
MCVCSVLTTDIYFQVRQARRRYTRLLTEALVNQLILRLSKCPDYPQPPKRGSPATVQFTRMTLIRPSCSSHRLEVGSSDTRSFQPESRGLHCELLLSQRCLAHRGFHVWYRNNFLSSLSTVLVLCVRYVSLLVLLCISTSSILESREFFARSSRSTSARSSYSSLSGTRTLIGHEGIYHPPTGFSTAPYANKTSRRNMCRADICNTCRSTKFIVSEKNSRKSSITSSFVESGRISLIYCSKVCKNLRTFPSTAGEAISSSSRLILLSRAPTRKTTSCHRRAFSEGTLYIVEVGDLAAVVGSAAAAFSLALPESSWAAR